VKAPRGAVLVAPSLTGAFTALYSGLVVTTVVSILPGVLSAEGVGGGGVALAVACFYLGRLALQMPIGALSDRMDNRVLIIAISLIVAGVASLGSGLVYVDLAGLGPATPTPEAAAFLLVTALVGGLSMPIFAVGNSLAFARGAGLPPVRIATTLLFFWSAGSVAGPLLVALLTPALGIYAMSAVIVVASLALAALALLRRIVRVRPAAPVSRTLSDVPVSSLALAKSVAQVEAAAAGAGAPAEAAPPAPPEPETLRT
jgi:MFS family permease